jgi:hypothetical protein
MESFYSHRKYTMFVCRGIHASIHLTKRLTLFKRTGNRMTIFRLRVPKVLEKEIIVMGI